jgi:lysophospholipase L1-like esterase
MAYRDVILAEPSLLHYWTMDESIVPTLHDSKGSSNLNSNAIFGSSGKVDGTSVSFNGINQGAQSISEVNLTSYNKVVVEMVVKFPNAFDDNNGFVYETSPGLEVGSFGFTPCSSSSPGYMSVFHHGNVGYSIANYARPSSNEWHHMVFIHDMSLATNEIQYYCDGVLKTVHSWDQNSNNTGNWGNFKLNLGCRNYGTLFLRMDMQHFAIYSSLTDMQIRRHYLDTFCVEHTITDSELWENSYVSTDVPRQSNGARFVFDTDSDFICVRGTTDLYDYFSSLSELITKVNGAYNSELQFSLSGQQDFEINLGSLGTSKRVEIINGIQSTGGTSSVKGSYVDSVFYKTGRSFSLISEPTSNRVMFYGDSITAGGNCDHPTKDGYVYLLRSGRQTIADAWGYRTLYDDANTEILLDAFVTKLLTVNPKFIYMAIGTVDYSLSKWDPNDFGDAYADVLDEIHSRDSSVSIICQSPIIRSSESANLLGHTTQEYRDAIQSACEGRSWSSYFDGYTILTLGDLVDGVHPSDAGHAKYATSIMGKLNSIIYSKVGESPSFSINYFYRPAGMS